MGSQWIDLSYLTDEERKHVLQVLERDVALHQRELDRVNKLKAEIRALRLKGVIKEGQDATKTCARCRDRFGWFSNKGDLCIQCRHKVCDKCRQYLPNLHWICNLCFKQMEVDAMSGHWFHALNQKNLRDKKTNEVIPAAEIVRSSIKRSKPMDRQVLVSFDVTDNRRTGSVKAPSHAGASVGNGPVKRDGTTKDQGLVNAVSAAPGTTKVVLTTPSKTQDEAHVDVDAASDEECEDISEMFASYGNKKANSHTNLNLLAPFSASKESIASVYSNAGEESYGKYAVTGEVQFSLEYDYKVNTLKIHVMACKDLAAVDPKRNWSDPYVKTYLLPDKTKTGKRKTRIKKRTINPVFDEVLKYQITKSELESRTLCVMVWNNDRFGRNDFLGEVQLPFNHNSFNSITPTWYQLQDRNQCPLSMLSYKGDLNICMKFVGPQHISGKKRGTTQKGELHVLVKQARNLTAVRSNGYSDTFCKSYLLPDKSRNAKRKSPVIKHDCNPMWNHTFLFEDVSWEEMRERSLELTVWDYDRLISNDFLGGVRLNLGTGKSFGRDVDWMDSKGDEVSLWQAMLDRPNCWIEGTLLLRIHMSQRK